MSKKEKPDLVVVEGGKDEAVKRLNALLVGSAEDLKAGIDLLVRLCKRGKLHSTQPSPDTVEKEPKDGA